jgi:hypothetical protein
VRTREEAGAAAVDSAAVHWSCAALAVSNNEHFATTSPPYGDPTTSLIPTCVAIAALALDLDISV